MLCGSWHAATADAKGANMNTNKALVLAGIKGVFVDRDPTRRFRTAPLRSRRSWETFRLTSGLSRVSLWRRATMSPLTAAFGWGPKPMVAVDIFRVANGKIAEHWDVMQEEVPAAQSANDNSS